MTGQGLELGKGFIQEDSFIFKNIKQKKMETEHQKKIQLILWQAWSLGSKECGLKYTLHISTGNSRRMGYSM